jgi:hypothetical protein
VIFCKTDLCFQGKKVGERTHFYWVKKTGGKGGSGESCEINVSFVRRILVRKAGSLAHRRASSGGGQEWGLGQVARLVLI